MRLNTPLFKRRRLVETALAISRPPKLKKRTRRRFVRSGIVLFNLALLIGVASFLFMNKSASPTVRRSTSSSAVQTVASVQNPLDTLSSVEIAAQIAQLTQMPETVAIRNQVDDEIAELSVVPSDSSIVAKPQLVTTGQKSKKQISRYKVQTGDTITSIATKYGISADSIRWSNGLNGDRAVAGNELIIPPGNGIAYQVRANDSVDGIASKYRADRAFLIVVNDLETSPLVAGEYIWIPNGQPPAPAAPRVTRSFAFGLNAVYGYNGYDYGYCTWYVANRVSVPANWGNANRWDSGARVSGWTLSKVPKAGAIGQSDAGGLGHVAYVEEVSADGSMIRYSDMNGLAGWGRVGYSGWVPALAKFQWFIYR